MEWRKYHKLCNQDHLPVLIEIFRLSRGGSGGFGYFQGQREKGKLFSSDPMGSGGKRELVRTRLVPFVLEVKSQGQLEVKLDCPALMGPTQGIVEVHVNLEEREGRPARNQSQCHPLSTYPYPGCSARLSPSCARLYLPQRGLGRDSVVL